jgi:hypothetical protein
LDHGSIEMAEGSGGDLLYGSLATRESDRIVFRSQIPDQCGHPTLISKHGERLL